ncbi:MAG: hypothetical protein V1779_05545 [bacterium]
MKNLIKLISISVLSIVSISIIVFLLTSCNEIEQGEPTCEYPFLTEKAGRIINHTDCKNIGGEIQEIVSASDECITFNYYMSYQIVRLSHINAGFNCCPEKINASYSFSKDTIKIFEKQAKAGCRCDCLYDINYELRNIYPGIYHIEIYGPLTDGINQPQFSCVVNIPDDFDSTFCIYRGFYPWQE